MPPVKTVTSLVTVPAMPNVPPLETKILSAVAPAETFSLPPLKSRPNSKVPPDNTLTVPEIEVPEPSTPLTKPPDDTVSTPPANTVALLAIVPATFNAPPEDTPML